MNSLEQMIDEMERKPEADVLLEWILENTTDSHVEDVIYAYFDSINGIK
jgi:hypothetical protein